MVLICIEIGIMGRKGGIYRALVKLWEKIAQLESRNGIFVLPNLF
jgi:hypothetical protein